MIQFMNMQHEEAAQALLNLQLASYVIEAQLLSFYDIPPLHDTIATIQEAQETFYGYYEQERLVGAISYEDEGEHRVICRLMVHPQYFRQGIASRLLAHILQLANGKEVFVTTGERNMPARTLYEQHGFWRIEEFEPVSGLLMVKYQKR